MQMSLSQRVRSAIKYIEPIIQQIDQTGFKRSIKKMIDLLVDRYVQIHQERNLLPILRLTIGKQNDTGVIFFWMSYLLAIHFKGYEDHFDLLIWYNLLYLLVDHALDDPNQTDKSAMIERMKYLLEHPGSFDPEPRLNAISQIYHKVLLRYPTAREFLILLFKEELRSVQIQSSNTHDLMTYRGICYAKAIATMDIYRVIFKIDQENAHKLTICAQIFDDCFDLFEDQKDHIHTIATESYRINGYIDELVLQALIWLGQLDHVWLLLSCLLTCGFFYLILNHPVLFSLAIQTEVANIKPRITFGRDLLNYLNERLSSKLTG